MSQQLVQDLIDRYLVAYSGEDARGCAETFTLDGQLHSPFGPAASGRDAIAATHMEWFEEKEEDKRLELTELQLNGDAGHCLLHWSANVADPDDPAKLVRAGGVSLAILTIDNGQAYFSRLALVPDAD